MFTSYTHKTSNNKRFGQLKCNIGYCNIIIYRICMKKKINFNKMVVRACT